jgi:hypothetical protein
LLGFLRNRESSFLFDLFLRIRRISFTQKAYHTKKGGDAITTFLKEINVSIKKDSSGGLWNVPPALILPDPDRISISTTEKIAVPPKPHTSLQHLPEQNSLL